MTTTQLTCRICSAVGKHPTFVGREMMFGTREEFEYFQCTECGCLQIEEIPIELSKYYPADYYSLAGERKGPKQRARPRAFLERLRVGNALFGRGYKLSKLASLFVDMPPELDQLGPLLRLCGVDSWNASFLDIGCGSWSWWLGRLKSLGFRNLEGVDPHIAQDVNIDGIRIHKGQLQDVSGRFDLISLHHSLEHIPDQTRTLRAIGGMLKPQGHCLVRIPLVSSLAWEMYGTDWVELDAPRHLYLHSLKSIALAGQQAGLKLVATTWDSTEFEFYASEQYRRGIPLVAENSFSRNPSMSDFTYREMAEFSVLAKRVNQEGRGGRGCFVFQLPS